MKTERPKGYTDESFQSLQRKSQSLLYELGTAEYNREFSIRETDRIQEELAKLEQKLVYAKRMEDQVERAAKAKENDEAAKAVGKQPEGHPNPELVNDTPVPAND